MYKVYVVRIYPSVFQENFFIRQFGCCRYVFNTFLSEKKLEYELFGEYLSYNDCSCKLTELKKEKTWLKEVDSIALIQSLRNLENAYDRFFNHISGFPRFKSKKNPVQSYRTQNINNSVRIEGNRIRLPKIGFIRFRTKQKILGTITSVTVKRKASGKYYISIQCKDVPQNIFKGNDRCCGIDLGLKNFVTINTGEIISFPQQKKITFLNRRKIRQQRRLSRKTRGSNNYKKQKRKLAITYEKIHNILKYHFYKIAQRLVEKYQVICLETLNIKGMLKNSKLSREIQEKAWHQFTTILEEKAKEHGRTVIYIDQWYPSSKTCNNCGYKNETLKLKDRTWTCPQCNTQHDRDVNAAKNILNEGLKELKEIQSQ